MMDSKRSGRRAAERSFGGRAQGDRAATQPGHADAAAESNGDEVRSRLEAAVVHTGAGLVELDRIIDPQLQCRPQHHFPAQPMTIDSLDKIPRLYHFTDRRNLDSIRHGADCGHSETFAGEALRSRRPVATNGVMTLMRWSASTATFISVFVPCTPWHTSRARTVGSSIQYFLK